MKETPEQRIKRANKAINETARAYIKNKASPHLLVALTMAVQEAEFLEKLS